MPARYILSFDQQHKKFSRQFLGRFVLLSQSHPDELLNFVVWRRSRLAPRPRFRCICIITMMKAHGVSPVASSRSGETRDAKTWFLELITQNWEIARLNSVHLARNQGITDVRSWAQSGSESPDLSPNDPKRIPKSASPMSASGPKQTSPLN